MKTGAQVGLAVAAGYVLGRYHKGKWALALAAMGAGKRLPGPQGAILDQGKKLLSSSPVVGHLTQEVRDQLAGAGRSALTSAASRRIESFSDALRERTEQMRGTGGDQAASEDPGEDSGSRPAPRRAPGSRKQSESGAARKPRGTSSRSSAAHRGTASARPRRSTGSSGQEARPRRRSGTGSGQQPAAASPRRGRARSSGQD
jgi:hypothetical protein